MKSILKLVAVLLIFSTLSCKSNNEKSETMDPQKIDKTQPSKIEDIESAKLFFTKDEIDFADSSDMYRSTKNEIILFRPTEFDFGKMVEDNQSDELVELDGNFEKLTNTIIDTFKNTTLAITICEKPYIAISNENDTLYFDTNKHLYGILFNKKGELPIFIEATENDVTSHIKNHYNL